MKFLDEMERFSKLSGYALAQKAEVSAPQYYKYKEPNKKGTTFSVLCRLRAASGISWESLGRLLDDEFLKKKKNTK